MACDSRYTLSTARKLTPRADAVLSRARGLSIIIIILSAFFSISKNVLTLRMPFDNTVAFSMSLEFIEMVPFTSKDCTVTSSTQVWLL